MLSLIAASFLALLQDGDVDRILIRFQQRREKVRSDGEFKRLLADSRQELEEFLKANPKHKDAPRAAFQIAETYLSAQDLDHAAERLRDYLRTYPDGPDAPSAQFGIAEVLLEKEKDAEARAAFDEFSRLYPKDDRGLYARLYSAVTLQNERNYDQAAELLKAARQQFKDRKESWGAVMQLAVVYHVQEKNPEARKLLEEIARDCPDREPREIARRHLAEYLKMGREAPGFSEKNIEGRDASMDALRGKVVVVYFFDPSTASSLAEATFLRQAREEAAKLGRAGDLEILGISIGTDRKDLAIYKAQAHSDWPLFFDGQGIDGKFARQYDVRGLPSLSLIDRKGRIRFFNIAGRDFRNSVAKLLEEK